MPKAESGLTLGKLNKSVDLTKKCPANVLSVRILKKNEKMITVERVQRHPSCTTYSHHSFKSNLRSKVLKASSKEQSMHTIGISLLDYTFLVRYLLSARSNLSAWGGLWWLWYPGKVCTWGAKKFSTVPERDWSLLWIIILGDKMFDWLVLLRTWRCRKG